MFLLRQSTHRMVIRYHPQIGHLYVPNLNARIPNELGGYFIRTNSEGFRSDVEFKRPRSGKPRILFFGDSYTAGDGCDNHERFSEVVGDSLGAEVYNYALSGSGTDQQLLIYEQFARDVHADLVVFCVAVHNIERIKVGYRESVDRVTNKHILVPKPFFRLENDALQLNQVPVPLHRPDAQANGNGNGHAKDIGSSSWFERALEMYRNEPKLARVRDFVSHSSSSLRSQILRLNRYQPHPDYKSADSPGWQLMQAILERFVEQVAPVPVLIVPVPTYYFYLHGLKPIFQDLYETMESSERGVHVADITTPLLRLPQAERDQLSFEHDGHFSPRGHQKIASLLTEEITARKLLPAKGNTSAITATPSRRRGGRSTYILGVSCFYHNSAACLVKDGQLVAAADEERFTRKKNDRGFPHYAVNYCLEEAHINQEDLSAVVYYDNASLTFERLMHTMLAVAPEGEQAWRGIMPSWTRTKLHLPQVIRRYMNYQGPILQENHHRTHAASAFYPSPFERAAILTIDGVGEWATASIGRGQGSKVELLKQMNFPHSLGLLYSAFTQFTGFKVNSGEYKMMGLAPYGEPKFVDTIYEHLLDLKEDGSVELNLEYFAYLGQATMTNDKFAALFGGPARDPDAWITQREMDLARSIQVVTEEAMLRMARHAHQLTGEKKLCLAGGVALNCVANGRLLREGPFEEIWIQPAAGDAGCALGAALDAYHTYFKKDRVLQKGQRHLQGGSYLGPCFSADEVRSFLDTHGYTYREVPAGQRASEVANLLAAGKVVGHFSGRMEFGPRALGARSILGDPRNQEMQVNLNVKIKYRESFRPFAPTVLAEKVADYFELNTESPYMLLVAPVKKERCVPFKREAGEDLLKVVRQLRSDIPAVTHVDYSARVQTIRREDHPAYYDLIKAFEDQTKYAVIVNTSFNVRGEPIICTPYDAYRCFMRTEMDALVLENFILLKDQQPAWPESKGHIEEHDDLTVPETDSPFLQALDNVYRTEFLPAAIKLRTSGGLRITTNFKRTPTMWSDVIKGDSAPETFMIPNAMDASAPKPDVLATAVTDSWTPGQATDLLRPVLRKLFETAQQFPEEETIEEAVSDSIYVMY